MLSAETPNVNLFSLCKKKKKSNFLDPNLSFDLKMNKCF